MALQGYSRWAAMLGALGVTIYLVWQAPEQEDVGEADSMPRRGSSIAAIADNAPELAMDWRQLLSAKRAWREEDESPDPFMVRLPAPPKPPPPPKEAAEEAEAPPEAPPLPFKYMGEANRGGAAREIYLLKGDQLYVVKQGDVLDQMYRVDAIERNVMRMVYLPLNIRQELGIGGVQ